jgi:hypothetical protein
MNDKNCILIFLKFPEKGKVKSRLAQDIGEDAALELYRYFILDLLDTLKTGSYTVIIYFLPPDARQEVLQWLGKEYRYMPQQGRDLGERMRNAFSEVFSEGFSKVLLIGSDIPDITDAILDSAFENEDDAVIGPALDGGYYLIGFRNNTFLPEAFDGMPWGTETVLKKTVELFRKKNLGVHLLPQWQDIDRLADLRDLSERNRDTAFSASRTMKYILKNYRILSGK